MEVVAFRHPVISKRASKDSIATSCKTSDESPVADTRKPALRRMTCIDSVRVDRLQRIECGGGFPYVLLWRHGYLRFMKVSELIDEEMLPEFISQSCRSLILTA